MENGLVTPPATIGLGWPVTVVSAGAVVPMMKDTAEESIKSPDGPRLRTRTCTVPVVTRSEGSTEAVNSVGLSTSVGIWDAANITTLPVVNLLMFPVKILPVKLVGGVKLAPCTVTSTVFAEFARAEAGLMDVTLGVVNPTVKSLLRLFLSVITIVLPPGETV